jgi:two-component system C4-dicarboxylate transport sensor histidine kinase DctB
MLTRMAALTGHLKTFARNSPSGLRERLDLATVVDQALHLLDARIRDEAVEWRCTWPARPGCAAMRSAWNRC